MNLVERVRSIVLSPQTEWPVIEAEAGSMRGIYTEYLLILAAIPAVAGFLGGSLIGMGGAFGLMINIPLVTGFANMVFGYVMWLLLVWGVAWIVNTLAPHFQSTPNMLNAFKLIAYSMTPGMVAGALLIVPALGRLVWLVMLYNIYLCYLGLPVLMKTPEDKRAPFLAVTVACGILMLIIMSAISSALVMPSMMYYG